MFNRTPWTRAAQGPRFRRSRSNYTKLYQLEQKRDFWSNSIIVDILRDRRGQQNLGPWATLPWTQQLTVTLLDGARLRRGYNLQF